jgi:hypothetical protein
MNTPQKPKDIPDPVSVPDEEQFEEFLEWTLAEEEELLRILNDPENDGMDGATS